MYRQGDILFEKIDEALAAGKPIQPEGGRIILARGEATGHHHSVSAAVCELAVTMEEVDAVVIRLLGPTAVEHQEHAPIHLDAGTYRVTRQREYAPEAPRRVAD